MEHLHTFTVLHENDLTKVIEFIKNQLFTNVFLFEGQLGAGKTTLIKHFIHSIDPNITVQSPTFSLLNVYDTQTLSVAHIDLYRIQSHEELIETGIPDLLPNFSLIFIEWFELILPWIQKAIIIKIALHEEIRTIELWKYASE